MLARNVLKSWFPRVKLTTYNGVGSYYAATAPTPTAAAIAPLPLLPTRHMPTPLLGGEILEELTLGTGQPAQRGHRKPLVWKRRQPWFDRQWSLDLARVKKGPETPNFPEGVPFTQIRAFQSFAGRSFKINAGRRRKIRLSLKRGRRKLL